MWSPTVVPRLDLQHLGSGATTTFGPFQTKQTEHQEGVTCNPHPMLHGINSIRAIVALQLRVCYFRILHFIYSPARVAMPKQQRVQKQDRTLLREWNDKSYGLSCSVRAAPPPAAVAPTIPIHDLALPLVVLNKQGWLLIAQLGFGCDLAQMIAQQQGAVW